MKIDLKFNKTLTRLSGNPFGEKTYIDQVKDKIDLSNIINSRESIEIIFPDNIENIGISFVKGFTREILEYVSKKELFEIFIIKGNIKLVERFEKSVYY